MPPMGHTFLSKIQLQSQRAVYFSHKNVPYSKNAIFEWAHRLEKLINSLISKYKTNFKGVGQPLRIALVGSRFGPGIYNIVLSLTKDEVVKRISKIN